MVSMIQICVKNAENIFKALSNIVLLEYIFSMNKDLKAPLYDQS